MISLSVLRELFEYNYWARDRQLGACTALTQEQFLRPLHSSFSSLRDTLAHLQWAEWVWLERWRGHSPTALEGGTKPRWRDNVVKYGLKPVLRKLGIQMRDVGLHAFRHGLATELADTNIPLPALQAQMRHADVRTTLRVYAHAIPASQRDAMERLAGNSIGTNVPIGTNLKEETLSTQ